MHNLTGSVVHFDVVDLKAPAGPPLVASEPIAIVRGRHGWRATLPACASAVWRVPR
jgi:hypothetical protein